MTKRDYVKFAAMFKECRPELNILEADTKERAKSFAAYGLWCRIVQNSADIFHSDNARFDRHRFLEACDLIPVQGGD